MPKSRPYPLGATVQEDGVNFALASEHAERVELVFFKGPDAREPSISHEMRERTGPIWHRFVEGVGPGTLYGYRVHGPYEPERGLRFNANKVLLDPYARAIGRPARWHDSLFGYRIGDERQDLSFSEEDSAPYAPLGAVEADHFDWAGEERPDIRWCDAIIYETHIKGISKLHPGVPAELRGTYLGLASDAVIGHLRELGVTAVQLLPVHAFLQDRHLVEKGLANYWGYNTLAFLAPEPSYAAGGPASAVREFKQMVKALHAAGFEVLLDVVYNHTAEGNRLGPTLSFRGIDSPTYYKKTPDDQRYHMDYTGTGNTLNVGSIHVLRLIMDSLRYWVLEMHVDGFRFDLASALARDLHEVNMLGPFFQIIEQDPVLSQVKLIAEPWDIGHGGYRVGGFPWQWAEWNGRYRDTVRDFWAGTPRMLGELATRLAGSADLYEESRRRPHASINFITAHDGFTLRDLVSYERKRNEANQEGNRDGEDHNRSSNCGEEGPSTDPTVVACRERRRRSLLATLLFSQGTPMVLGGDELSKTQDGNNNTYCQDNKLNWYRWELDEEEAEFLEFARSLIAFRAAHPTFRRRHFLTGAENEAGRRDVSWWHPAGREMSDGDWHDDGLHSLAMLLDRVDPGDTEDAPGDRATLIVLTGGGGEFRLPEPPDHGTWVVAFTTEPQRPAVEAGVLHFGGQAVTVLQPSA